MTAGRRALRLRADGRLDAPELVGAPALRRLLALLDRDGERARVVGGAVRNALLGLPVADVDLATTAEPAAVAARARAAGLRVVPTGVAHGTVTVLVDGTPFEVTTLRRDVDTDGRHATVRFSRDFDEDARRRDFTVNALSVGADGVVHDTVGGIADLRAGRVRFIGDPDTRITEDFLRLLRFFRFHAAYGLGPLDPDGLDAAVRHRDALARLSRERVRAELLKLLAAPGAVPVVEAMTGAGVTERVLGAPGAPGRLARLVARGAEGASGAPPDALLRLMALGLDGPAAAPRLRDALRLSNAEWRRLEEAGATRAGLSPETPLDRAGTLAHLFIGGEQAAADAIALALADAGPAEVPAWRAALDVARTAERPRLPVGGTELLGRGLAGGRRVGVALKALQAAWIKAGFPQDPAELSRLIDEAVAAAGGAEGPVAPAEGFRP